MTLDEQQNYKWDYKPKMESMNADQLKERIQRAYDWEMPKLTMIPYIGIEELVSYSTDELIARCPVTGISDLYKLNITFIPDELLPELKSLKIYLNNFAELPISHEHLASKLYNEFKSQVKPKSLYLSLDVAIRGGIRTIIELGGKNEIMSYNTN